MGFERTGDALAGPRSKIGELAVLAMVEDRAGGRLGDSALVSVLVRAHGVAAKRVPPLPTGRSIRLGALPPVRGDRGARHGRRARRHRAEHDRPLHPEGQKGGLRAVRFDAPAARQGARQESTGAGGCVLRVARDVRGRRRTSMESSRWLCWQPFVWRCTRPRSRSASGRCVPAGGPGKMLGEIEASLRGTTVGSGRALARTEELG